MLKLINDFIQYCEVEKGLSKTTITQYRCNLLRFYKYANNTPLEDITHQFVLDFLKQFKGLSQRIVAITSLRVFGRFLKQEEIDTIFTSIQTPKRPKKIPDILSEQEAKKLLDSLGAPEERIVFETLYSTGMRISEYINLKREDIDFKNGLVRIDKAKMGSVGIIPIGRRALDLIKKYGLPELTRSNIYAMFQKYSLILGKRIWPHMWRHCCATHMWARGADIRYIQEQMRHAYVSTTVGYTQICPEALKKIQHSLEDKDALKGRIPYFPEAKPKVKTPQELTEEKELAENAKSVMKREEVNPLLNAEQAGKILGMYKQSVTGYARAGYLKGEYAKGLGFFFRKNYIDFVNKIQPEWLVAHKKFKRRDIKDMIKKTIAILKESGKKLAPQGTDFRIHYNRKIYMPPLELTDKLGVGPRYVYKTLFPALYKYLRMRTWAEQKLFEAWRKEFKTEMIEELKQIEKQDLMSVLD